MKEIEQNINNKSDIEVSVKQKKQVEHQLIGNIIPYEGHIIWKINKETLEIEKAKFINKAYIVGSENKKEIIQQDGFFYCSALNKKNALKKYFQNKNGSMELGEEKLPF